MGAGRRLTDRLLAERYVAFWQVAGALAAVIALILTIVVMANGGDSEPAGQPSGLGGAGATATQGSSMPEPSFTAETPTAPTSSDTPDDAAPYKADWSIGTDGWATTGDWHAVDGMLVND